MPEFKNTLYLRADGRLARTQPGDLTNIGGTVNNTFTVNGRGLLFDDGTSTDGGGGAGVIGVSSNLQQAYNHLVNINGDANVVLNANQDLIFTSNNQSNYFKIDANTGNVTVTGTINGILVNDIANHLTFSSTDKHKAGEISITQISQIPTATNVQTALALLATQIQNGGGASSHGYEHVQSSASSVWNINHSLNTKRIQWSLWDEHDESILPDFVKIVDNNTITVNFTVPVIGKFVITSF